MKTQRSFASLCLLAGCCALFAATNVSVGQQPGVVRLTSGQENFEPPIPVPPAQEQPGAGDGMANGGAGGIPPTNAAPTYAPMPDGGLPFAAGETSQPPVFMPQQPDYTPYFGQSGGVTESPVLGRTPQDNPLFGPVLMWESTIGDGLGFGTSFHRLNARLPYHVVPGNSVLLADLSASMTDTNQDLFNLGLVWRNYDAMRNRVFGWNAFWDSDDGRGNGNPWQRVGVGVESLGRYIDFRANGYFVSNRDSVLLNDQLIGSLTQVGNTVQRVRNQQRDNAYSGVDIEAGGPLPFLGRRGCNLYAGAYYLDNDYGYETVGFSARFQALVTSNATLNLRVTDDDTFGTNAWFSVSYTIPNYFENKIFEPKNVRDRLADPVYRSNRVHSNIDVINVPEAIVNAKTGLPWNIAYVNPDQTLPGTGTFENPYNNLQVAANNNNPLIDVIQVTPRADDSGTNLTVNGGMTLFESQALVSSTKDYTLFTEAGQDFVLPGSTTSTGLGPLVSNPTMSVGGSVIRVTNGNTVQGLRINAANSAGTIAGNGITNSLPAENLSIICNTFLNYNSGARLTDVSGNVIIDENTFDGTDGVSNEGLLLSTAAGSLTNLLVRNNSVNESQVVGLSVTVNNGGTLNADDPNGIITPIATGITGNSVTTSGDGLTIASATGATAHVLAENNSLTSNTGDGFSATTDGGTFNLVSLRSNNFESNEGNGAVLGYSNGGRFVAISEDINEDVNLNGILDPGEDLDLDGVLDVADGILQAGEDTNLNGLLDQGIVSNTFTNNTLGGLRIVATENSIGSLDIGGPAVALGNSFAGNLDGGLVGQLQDTSITRLNAMNNRSFQSSVATGDLIRMGFDQNILAANDDGSTGLTPIGFDIDFFGRQFSDLFVNNNGNVTFDSSLFAFTPFPLLTTATPIIAPFFADVDTRAGNEVTYGNELVDGRNAFGVNWLGVRHFDATDPNGGLPENSFQLVLIDRSDVAAGDFDIEFNYDSILWEAGTASNSDPDGLGGDTARIGFTNGVSRAFELPGSAIPGAFLDSGPAATSLVQNSLNSGVLGRYVFEARNGNVGTGAVATTDADGIRFDVTDNAQLLTGRFINNDFRRSLGDGMEVNTSGNAQANLLIQGNTFTDTIRDGIRLTAAGTNSMINATVGGTGTNTLDGTTFAQGNTLSSNGNAGVSGDGLFINATGGGTVAGSIRGNTADGNSNSGIRMLADDGTIDFGTPPDRTIDENTLTNNGNAGLELLTNSTATGNTLLNAVVRTNTISNNQQGGVVASAAGVNMNGNTNNVLNLTVGGTTAQANTIDANGNVGIGFSTDGNTLGNLVVSNATISGTTAVAGDPLSGNGIDINRSGSSLLTATVENVTGTSNEGDGLSVDAQGNDRQDPGQPLSGTISSVTWNNNTFDNNGRNGAQFRVRGVAQLLADGQNNAVTDNGDNGILIDSSESSSFGDPTTGLPPGRRVVIDGTTATGNGADGIQLVSTEQSRILAEITSTTGFDTTIENNGSDGIQVVSSGGASDIVVTAAGGSTTIRNNGSADNDGDGAADGGNGIRWDATGTSEGTLRVTNTTIASNIAGPTEDETLNGNGVLDPGEDVNGNGVLDTGEDDNGDVNVTHGDGIQYNVFGSASSTLIVGGVTEGNIIQNNEDDGVAITATGTQLGFSRPIITIAGNTIGGSSNGLQAGNGGDGISMNIAGGTDSVNPALIDLTIADGTPIDNGTPGVEESGPIIQMIVNDNVISNNGQRGVNLLLNGAAGERDRENGNSFVDPVLVSITDNLITSNGTDGIYFRGDSDMNQGRFATLGNDGFPNNDRIQTPTFYSPLLPEFQGFNLNTVNNTTGFGAVAADGEAAYLNLRTVQNTHLLVTGNTVQNNGVSTVSGGGLILEVGTGSYLAADIRDNLFGGNLEQDLRTESFLSSSQVLSSIDNNQAGTFDAVFLDDSAQLDMRFSNNAGNQIFVNSAGATYTDRDLLKEIVLGFDANGLSGVTDRDAGLFQVDDGPNLNNPNNSFINFGITQDIEAGFSSGRYNLRSGADPNYPNIGFAPFLP